MLLSEINTNSLPELKEQKPVNTITVRMMESYSIFMFLFARRWKLRIARKSKMLKIVQFVMMGIFWIPTKNAKKIRKKEWPIVRNISRKILVRLVPKISIW